MQWYVLICSLFNGHLVDKPVHEAQETYGREVEHKVFMFSNLILLVIEMKFTFKNDWDYYAQVLLELVCETLHLLYHKYYKSDFVDQSAMKLNCDRDLDPQPPIYTMLSDLCNLYFLSYDGARFHCMAKISISQRPCTLFMKWMTQGIFLHCSRLPASY